MDYLSKITADLVRQMVAAIVKRDNVKNLGKRYDALAEQYPETAEVIAKAAKYSAGPVCTSLDVLSQTTECFAAVRVHRYHRFAVANALHKLLACPRLETDKAENLLVKYYFTHEGLGPVVVLQNQDEFKKLVAEAQNPSRAVIWEVKSEHDEGALTLHCTVAPGTDAKLAEPLFRFIGEHTHIDLRQGYPCISKDNPSSHSA